MALKTLVKLPEVVAATKISRAEIYRRIKDGTFPTPLKLGKRNTAWLESDINNWIDEHADQASRRVEERRD